MMKTEPELIKAGDERVLLGPSKTPPLVDCRIVSEESYQEFLDVLDDVRKADLENYRNGHSPLLPLKTRNKIREILTLHWK